ncbi:fumarylacetoacetate hydrolase family protein [Gulosibacter macacae]|nr:fumarylacetoacetate hydrolase family protein [Gulosibacter macacae]
MQPVGPILAAGANYREHILQMSVAHKLGRADATEEELWDEAAAENDARRRSGDPYIWTGLPSAICGAFDDVQLPDVGDDLDWELELGVVIGRSAYRIEAQDAGKVIAGYTIVNDLTARTLVPRPDMAMIGTDWFRAKNQPTFFPTGPVLVPARFIPDPKALRIQLQLNGQMMQDATTDDLLFDIPSLIAYASSIARLEPGDLLITGSPAGNGSHWGRFLQDGDEMTASITGLGTQRNRVRAATGILPPWQASRA